jgi:hypothetical protein
MNFESRVDCLKERLGAKGLGENLDLLGVDPFVGVSRHVEDTNLWPFLQETASHLRSFKPGHDNVREQQVDVAMLGVAHVECSQAVGCLQDRVTVVAQDAGHQAAQALVIFN